MMVVVADRDAESFLGFVLLDDEPIQVALDVARSELELKDGMRLLLVRSSSAVSAGFACAGVAKLARKNS